MGFVACDEVEESLSKPQENQQEPVMTVNGLETSVPIATAAAVDLKAYANENREGLVPVLDVAKMENFPENSVLAGKMELSKTADFDKVWPIALQSQTPEGGATQLMAPVADWETAHIEMYTKNPQTTTTYIRIYLYAVNGTEKVTLMNGDSRIFNERKLEVTPLDAVRPIEETYYLVTEAGSIKMTATNPANVYDPPTFTAIFDAPAQFRIMSESKVYYGAGAEEGTLDPESTETIKVENAAPHMITVNMEKLTYTVSLAIEHLYVYSSAPANGYTLTTDNFINYKGFAGFRGSAPSFRLAGEKDNATTLLWGIGLDDAGNPIEGTLEASETPTPVPLEGPGCYFINVNMGGLTYSASHISSFGLIGGFNGWSADVEMTATDRYGMIWTAELAITNGTEFKIRTNGDWEGADIGAGSDPSDLSTLYEHGGNIVWNEGDGTFTVTLDLNNVPYTLTAVKK